VCNKAGIDLPNDLKAGPGLKFTHGWGAVLSPHAVLGRDVIVMHGATIGAMGRQAPTIGDGVFIGAGAIILGGVHIGNGATISAGSVVTKDVEPHMMIAGNPQRVVKRYERPPEKPYAPVRARNSADMTRPSAPVGRRGVDTAFPRQSSGLKIPVLRQRAVSDAQERRGQTAADDSPHGPADDRL